MPQEDLKVLKLRSKPYIQLPLGNWFGQVHAGGKQWEEETA